jgi:hypothetical protein
MNQRRMSSFLSLHILKCEDQDWGIERGLGLRRTIPQTVEEGQRKLDDGRFLQMRVSGKSTQAAEYTLPALFTPA